MHKPKRSNARKFKLEHQLQGANQMIRSDGKP